MHAFDRQTDRQTDRNLIVRPRLHSMQRGKKRTNTLVYAISGQKTTKHFIECLAIFSTLQQRDDRRFENVNATLYSLQKSEANNENKIIQTLHTLLQAGCFHACNSHSLLQHRLRGYSGLQQRWGKLGRWWEPIAICLRFAIFSIETLWVCALMPMLC